MFNKLFKRNSKAYEFINGIDLSVFYPVLCENHWYNTVELGQVHHTYFKVDTKLGTRYIIKEFNKGNQFFKLYDGIAIDSKKFYRTELLYSVKILNLYNGSKGVMICEPKQYIEHTGMNEEEIFLSILEISNISKEKVEIRNELAKQHKHANERFKLRFKGVK